MKAEEAVHTIMLNSDWEHVGETKYRKVIINDKEFEEYKVASNGFIQSKEVIVDLSARGMTPEPGDIDAMMDGIIVLYVLFNVCKQYLEDRNIKHLDNEWLPRPRVERLLMICGDVMESEDNCELLVNVNDNIQN